MCLWLAVYILWKNVYPGALLVLKLWYFLFVLSFMGSLWAFPGAADGKKSAYNAGDMILILGSGRYSGEGNGNPHQYSCLENPINRGPWWSIVLGVARVVGEGSGTPLQYSCLENPMDGGAW